MTRTLRVVFIDAVRVKVREGTVANRPIYLALGVTGEGKRDLLGLWAGDPGDGEGAKYWLRVLTGLRNRGNKPDSGNAKLLEASTPKPS